MMVIFSWKRKLYQRATTLVSLLICFLTSALSIAYAQDSRPPRDTVIVMQAGACERRCPVFKLIIFGDGTVLFQGEAFLKTRGIKKTSIPLERVKQLVDAFQAVDYFQLTDDYGYKGPLCRPFQEGDGPVAMISFVSGGKGKSINHHHDCQGSVPEQLRKLEDEIVKIANAKKWL